MSPEDVDKLQLAATLVCVRAALTATLVRLSAFHGHRAGPWLDELEAKFVEDASNVEFAGIPMELETKLVDTIVASFRALFDDARDKLDGKGESSSPSRLD